MTVDLYACLIDYRKAFDCVKHEKIESILEAIEIEIELLKATGIDRQEIKTISQLYWSQTAEIVEQVTSDEVRIREGVQQGCIPTPLLFNLYSEAVFKETLQGVSERGVRVNGVVLNNFKYA